MSKLTICVPTPGSPLAKRLAPGSAIVTALETVKGVFPDIDCTVFFEGNLYKAEMLSTFCQKLACAAGRMATKYPTVATSKVSSSELIYVGTYDYEYKLVEITRPDLVMAWEKGTGVFDSELKDPATVRLVLNVDYELNGTSIESMKHALSQALEREIGNGALTGETSAEVNEWRLEVL